MIDERRRLLERVFSREGAAEHPEEHRDPTTGATVRTTPSQWALAEYDRVHRVASPDDADAPGGDDGAADAPRRVGDRETDDFPVERRPIEDARPREPHRTGRALAVAAAAFAVGVAVTLSVSAAGHGPSTPTAAALSTGVSFPGDAPGPDGSAARPGDGGFHAMPGPMLDDQGRVKGLLAGITDGYYPSTFHLASGNVVTQDRSAIYAAVRLDGEYCLVAVLEGSRVASSCDTEDGIGEHGLSLSIPNHEADGTASTGTVYWQTDGTINWVVAPAAG